MEEEVVEGGRKVVRKRPRRLTRESTKMRSARLEKEREWLSGVTARDPKAEYGK